MKLWDNPRIQPGTIGREIPAMSAPGSIATLWPGAGHFRCSPNSGHAAAPQ